MTDEKKFEARTWKCGENSLVLEKTSAGDETALMWIGAPDDGPGVLPTPQQMRELAHALAKRADLLDPPDKRWKDLPRTPGQVVHDFLASGKWATQRVWDESEPPMLTYSRHAHIVDCFTVVVLMTELEKAAPDRAKVIAERLGDAYDDGGVIHELLWEWSEDREQGKPIGFDPPATLPLADA